jgi:hypothetical protein
MRNVCGGAVQWPKKHPVTSPELLQSVNFPSLSLRNFQLLFPDPDMCSGEDKFMILKRCVKSVSNCAFNHLEAQFSV